MLMPSETKAKCFTIMPFTVRDEDLPRYSNDKNHWNEVYRGLIIRATKEAGLDCERDDEDSATRFITEGIWRKIEAADVILCDLSAHNPNVYLELGWALRADKRFVLVKDDVTHFNFDLNQYYTYEYSHRLQPSSVERSIGELGEVLRATLRDGERKYSMVAKLSLQLQASKAAQGGNIEIRLLQDLLSEVRSSRAGQLFSSPNRVQSRFSFPDVRSQTDLASMLIGTTWRKTNDLEHLIFETGNTFYNNHAGHASWRKNTYSLGQQLGTMTLVWSVDGLEAPCKFNEYFNEFDELANPRESVWSIIATEPHTPSWGV
jgi:hypothetical protein